MIFDYSMGIGVLGIVLAVVWPFLWEARLRDPLLAWSDRLKRKKNLLQLLGLSSVIRIDYTAFGDPPRPRFADSLISNRLSNLSATGMTLLPGPKIQEALLESSVIVIGATKYSESANWIQQQFDLHYQHVIDYGSEGEEITRIVSRYGEEFTASQDIGHYVDGLMIGYGTFTTYKNQRGKTLCWIAGTHGNASLGVCQHVMENPNAFTTFQRIKESEGLIWLVRVHYRPNEETFDSIVKVEIVEDPLPVVRRRANASKPKALIVDLGNVLFHYDYNKVFHEFAARSEKSPDEIRTAIYETEIFDAYQMGKLTSQSFYKKVCAAAEIKLDFDEFAMGWARIFTLNVAMHNALIKLSEQTQLVMFSNSNQLQWNHLKSTYPDVFRVFEGRAFSSHLVGASKPDAQSFRHAASAVGSDVDPSDCLFVDDNAGHVQAAERHGFRGHRFIRFGGFAYWIRENGLYIP